MSGAITSAVIAAVGVAASVYSSNQQKKAQARALEAQKKAAYEQQKQAEQSLNAQNSNKANAMNSLMNAQKQADGVGSTMLTGSTGINSGSLKLGKASLLGGGGS